METKELPPEKKRANELAHTLARLGFRSPLPAIGRLPELFEKVPLSEGWKNPQLQQKAHNG